MSSPPETLALLQNAGKRYVKFEDVPTMLAGMRRLLKRGKRSQLWAVRHVDLEIAQGEFYTLLGYKATYQFPLEGEPHYVGLERGVLDAARLRALHAVPADHDDSAGGECIKAAGRTIDGMKRGSLGLRPAPG